MKQETGSRLRGRIETVLEFSAAEDYRDRNVENPAKLKYLKLPKRKKPRVRVKRHRSMPYEDLPAFMAQLRSRSGISALALEFTILTATRTGGVIHATWDEIDLEKRLWTTQPDRIATKISDEQPRRVPLSDRAIAILKSLPREEGNPHVFVGGKAGKGLSNMAMLELMRELAPHETKPKLSKYVTHGFRTTFKSWCVNMTNFPNRVSEAALWHVVEDETEASYNRDDVLERRIPLMAAWAGYCARPPVATGEKVTPIRGQKEVSR